MFLHWEMHIIVSMTTVHPSQGLTKTHRTLPLHCAFSHVLSQCPVSSKAGCWPKGNLYSKGF